MLVLLKDKNHTMISADIRHRTWKILKLLPADAQKPHDQEEIDKLLAGIRNADQEQHEMKSGETEIIQGARDGGTLPIKKHYRLHFLEHATDLHISKMEDFYGNRILLTMAPLPKQFIDHWEAIWRQSVGVIVWLGRIEDKRQRNMDPYIGMVENDVVHFGPLKITTVHTRKGIWNTTPTRYW